MPLDPFFTSQVRDESAEQRQAKRAKAKAWQFRLWTRRGGRKTKETALRHVLRNTNDITLSILRKGPHVITRQPSLRGFASGKKKWVHRDNKNPKGLSDYDKRLELEELYKQAKELYEESGLDEAKELMEETFEAWQAYVEKRKRWMAKKGITLTRSKQ